MSEKSIYHRMLDVMAEVSYIQKEDKKVNDQYRFVSHDAVASKVREALLKHQVIFEERILEKTLDLKEVTETVLAWNKTAGAKTPVLDADGKPMEKTVTGYVCTIFMEFVFINPDKPEERMVAHGYGMGLDTQDKATGKAMSYAKKYALLNALLLETGDDPERDTNVRINNQSIKKRGDTTANKKKYEEYLQCLGRATTKEAWLKVKPYKDQWVTWAEANYGIDYSEQLNDKFLALAMKFEAAGMAKPEATNTNDDLNDDLPDFMK